MNPNILETRDITVKVPDRYLLKDVSITVRAGEIMAVIGPNGAGKTTLLLTLLGLMDRDSGDILFAGKAVDDLRGLPIGYVPQRLEFDRTFPITVAEFVGLSFVRGWRVPVTFTDGERRAVHRALAKVGAENLAAEPVGYLSGGELQRVMLAKALIAKPRLLLLDEPATGIDIRGEQQFYRLVNDLRRHEHVGILLVSHDLNIVYKFASRVVCLSQSVKCEGLPTEVLTMENLNKTYGGLVGLYHHHD